jgi:hypothetical protein
MYTHHDGYMHIGVHVFAQTFDFSEMMCTFFEKRPHPSTRTIILASFESSRRVFVGKSSQ